MSGKGRDVMPPDEELEEGLDESFPASDPPSYMPPAPGDEEE